DLYYRLNVVRIDLPPLRERKEDIPFLVAHFYRQLAGGGTDGNPPTKLTASMAQQHWPGNVRELRHAVERVVLFGDADGWGSAGDGGSPESVSNTPGEIWHPTSLDEELARLSFKEAKERALASWERWYVTELIRRTDGNLSEAARRARMDRNYLRELLRRHAVDIGSCLDRNDGRSGRDGQE
ncbi:MAG: hypothetical protein V2A73_06170, partial [Pseudomonadota bacterium]